MALPKMMNLANVKTFKSLLRISSHEYNFGVDLSTSTDIFSQNQVQNGSLFNIHTHQMCSKCGEKKKREL